MKHKRQTISKSGDEGDEKVEGKPKVPKSIAESPSSEDKKSCQSCDLLTPSSSPCSGSNSTTPTADQPKKGRRLSPHSSTPTSQDNNNSSFFKDNNNALSTAIEQVPSGLTTKLTKNKPSGNNNLKNGPSLDHRDSSLANQSGDNETGGNSGKTSKKSFVHSPSELKVMQYSGGELSFSSGSLPIHDKSPLLEKISNARLDSLGNSAPLAPTTKSKGSPLGKLCERKKGAKNNQSGVPVEYPMGTGLSGRLYSQFSPLTSPIKSTVETNSNSRYYASTSAPTYSGGCYGHANPVHYTSQSENYTPHPVHQGNYSGGNSSYGVNAPEPSIRDSNCYNSASSHYAQSSYGNYYQSNTNQAEHPINDSGSSNAYYQNNSNTNYAYSAYAHSQYSSSTNEATPSDGFYSNSSAYVEAGYYGNAYQGHGAGNSYVNHSGHEAETYNQQSSGSYSNGGTGYFDPTSSHHHSGENSSDFNFLSNISSEYAPEYYQLT